MNPSVLTIFFKSSHFIPIQRSESFSKTDLVANCGGILGLFMGFSLISMAELLYYCTVRPFCIMYRCRKEKHKNIEKVSSTTDDNNIKVTEWNQMMYVSENRYANRNGRAKKNENAIAYIN